MKFHLNFKPSTCGFNISHQHQLFLIGSCFSDNIGDRLQAHKFQSVQNPCGVLFNPISIQQTLMHGIQKPKPNANILLEQNNQVFSFLHHSKIKAGSKNELLQNIQVLNDQNHQALQASDFIFITFGSAYHYYHTELMVTVANCHKQNQNLFEKRLMQALEIVNIYNALLAELKQINPKLKCIFTVSPVKHLKDGVVENNRSKSILIMAVHQLVEENENAYYFPAYELVNDDLRDYRFYKADLAHPNELAVDYVWQKFSDCFFEENTKKINIEIQKLNAYLNHNNLHAAQHNGSEHEPYIENQKKCIQQLYPEIQF
ncbi:MAG: GSCFA domain-containing protein [Bacteroidota bacterium]